MFVRDRSRTFLKIEDEQFECRTLLSLLNFTRLSDSAGSLVALMCGVVVIRAGSSSLGLGQ